MASRRRCWAAALLLVGCTGYQWEPYVEAQYRDEEFEGAALPTTYDGVTFGGGVRYVPPTYHTDRQWGDLVAAMREAARPAVAPAAQAPVLVDAKDEPLINKETVESLGTAGTVGGALCIAALALLVWVWRRRSRPAVPKPS